MQQRSSESVRAELGGRKTTYQRMTVPSGRRYKNLEMPKLRATKELETTEQQDAAIGVTDLIQLMREE